MAQRARQQEAGTKHLGLQHRAGESPEALSLFPPPHTRPGLSPELGSISTWEWQQRPCGDRVRAALGTSQGRVFWPEHTDERGADDILAGTQARWADRTLCSHVENPAESPSCILAGALPVASHLPRRLSWVPAPRPMPVWEGGGVPSP